jgi:hypothetical protein
VVHTVSSLADAERTKSGMGLALASDGVHELASERFLLGGRRSMEDSLGTRFNDIFGCSEKHVGRIKTHDRVRPTQAIGPLMGPGNLQSYLAFWYSRATKLYYV